MTRRGAGGRRCCAGSLVLLAVEYASVPLRFAAAPPASTAVGRWLAATKEPGAVIQLPLAIDRENTPAMVDSLEHRRPLVNGYSGQRPSFFSAAVDAMAGFPSIESMWMLKDLEVRFIVSPRPVDVAEWPLVERASVADPVRGTHWIYELAWSPAVEARLGEPKTPIPPAPGPVPFHFGERLAYDVTWHAPTGTVNAGTVVLGVEAPDESGASGELRPVYAFTLTARTAPWIARFFEADDRFLTTTDAQLFPQRHTRALREGRREVDQQVRFDQSRLQAQPLSAEGQPTGPAVRLWPHVRDGLSAFYFVRTLTLAPGARVEIPIVENGRHSTLELRVTGEEVLQQAGKPVTALRMDVHLRQRVARRKAPEIRVWMARDPPRALLAAEVDASFGNLRVALDGRR